MMARLEHLTKGTRVRGIAPSGPVTVIDAEWVGSDVVKLTYEDSGGKVDRELVYRTNEAELAIDGNVSAMLLLQAICYGEEWQPALKLG